MPAAIRTARQLAMTCARLAADKKAEAIAVLEVGPLLAITEYFVLATAGNPRQIRAIADDLVASLKARGVRCVHREGRPEAGWILVDFDVVVVHLFDADRRKFYDLDAVWADAKRVPWEPRKESNESF